MTTEKITLPGCEMLLVKLPPFAHDIEVMPNGDLLFWNEQEHLEKFSSRIGDWTPLGFAADLTEEQWAEVVEKEFDTYRDYGFSEEIGSYVFSTATESGRSLLESVGWFVENPVPKPETEYDAEGHAHYPLQQYIEKWQSAQAKTNPYILIKRK